MPKNLKVDQAEFSVVRKKNASWVKQMNFRHDTKCNFQSRKKKKRTTERLSGISPENPFSKSPRLPRNTKLMFANCKSVKLPICLALSNACTERTIDNGLISFQVQNLHMKQSSTTAYTSVRKMWANNWRTHKLSFKCHRTHKYLPFFLLK